MAQYGINVNAVCPGLIDTPTMDSEACRAKLDYFLKQIPFKRLDKPQDAADLILFLASDESSYITGATVDLNGGSLMM